MTSEDIAEEAEEFDKLIEQSTPITGVKEDTSCQHKYRWVRLLYSNQVMSEAGHSNDEDNEGSDNWYNKKCDEIMRRRILSRYNNHSRERTQK